MSERISPDILAEYRRIAGWLETQAALRGPAGDTMHGLAAEALNALLDHAEATHAD